MNTARKKIKKYEYIFDFSRKEHCSGQECEQFSKMDQSELPEDIFKDGDGYFRYVEEDLTEDEIKKLVTLQKLHYLRIIKNVSIWFVVLFAIFAIISVFILLGIVSNL